jgi:CSLREA domain-containing protein
MTTLLHAASPSDDSDDNVTANAIASSPPASGWGWLAGLLVLALTLGVAIAPQVAVAQDQTFTVNSTADAGDDNPGDGTCATSGGACTLRAAIEEANSDPDADVINFADIPTTSGFATISLNSELAVTEELDIDGNTAPGYPSASADGPIVKLDGSNISGSTADGIEFGGDAAQSSVSGLAIVNMPDEGINIFAADVAVTGCFIGMDVDGETVQANNRNPDVNAAGIAVEGSGANINGNVVSGNQGNGVLVTTDDNSIINNTVGLDYDGDAAKGNGQNGILVEGNDNAIGGTLGSGNLLLESGNVVSANDANGILIRGNNNEVTANEVGTSADGSTAQGTGGDALGNAFDGIVVAGFSGDPAANNLIGDDRVPEDRNLVSGNEGDGIVLGFSRGVASQDTVRGNVIGLNAARDQAIPNDNSGIVGRIVGGAVIDSNVVSGNGGWGILITVNFAGGTNGDIEIYDNIVGTNRSFTSGLGNTEDGIQVRPNPSSNPDDIDVVENIVGNNDGDGIEIRGSYHDVLNNYVGVAPDGNDIGNGDSDQGRGIILNNIGSSLTNVPVGGVSVNFIGYPGNGEAAGFSTPNGTGNVIGYNRSDGILLGGQASGLIIEENYVGTNPSGADVGNGTGSGLGSAGDGIRIVENGNSVSGIGVGYDEGDSFSNPDPADGGQGNVVAYNSGDGISVGADENATDVSDVTVRGNRVFQNGDANSTTIGIDLGNSGQTANDAGDTDNGPNGLQNFPSINAVDYDASTNTVTIEYEVSTNDTGSNYPLTIDFYAADSESSGEGKTYLGSQEYSTANTPASVGFDLSNYPNVSSDDFFVATATDANGNTSEFMATANQLPVELASFEARRAGSEQVALTWQTASETNNAGFRVERQQTGAPTASRAGDSWEQIGYVESKATGGTTTEALDYRFQDREVPFAADTVRYRLTQVDTDGATHRSDVVEVALGGVDQLTLKAPYPNPARGAVTVKLAVPQAKSGGAELRLYNALGQQVRAVPVGESGRQRVEVQTDGLASGVYFLRLTAGEATKTQRVTVVR